MKNLRLVFLFVIPITSFGIDPDVIRYPANEYRREVEYAKPAPNEVSDEQLSLEEEEIRTQAREQYAPLESYERSQTAPKHSTYVPPPFDDNHHLGTREMRDAHGQEINKNLGQGLPSHAMPPRGLTPQRKHGEIPSYPAD